MTGKVGTWFRYERTGVTSFRKILPERFKLLRARRRNQAVQTWETQPCETGACPGFRSPLDLSRRNLLPISVMTSLRMC